VLPQAPESAGDRDSPPIPHTLNVFGVSLSMPFGIEAQCLRHSACPWSISNACLDPLLPKAAAVPDIIGGIVLEKIVKSSSKVLNFPCTKLATLQ